MSDSEAIKKIQLDIEQMKKESRITSSIQIGAIVLAFFFGIITVRDLKKRIS